MQSDVSRQIIPQPIYALPCFVYLNATPHGFPLSTPPSPPPSSSRIIAQAATISKLIPDNRILLIRPKLRRRIQQPRLDGADVIEVVAHVEQLQLRGSPRCGREVPGLLDDVVVGPGADDLDVAFRGGDDGLCGYMRIAFR